MDKIVRDETQEVIEQRNQWMVVALEKRQVAADLRAELAELKKGQQHIQKNDARMEEIIARQRYVIRRLRAEISQGKAEKQGSTDLRVAALEVQLKERDEMIAGLRETIARLEVAITTGRPPVQIYDEPLIHMGRPPRFTQE